MTERKVTEKFPEEIYSGITILIDIEEARKEFFPLLKEFGVDAEFLVNLWKNGLPCRIIRETGRLRELFRGLYESEDILSTGMVRVKLAEFAVLVEELGRSGQKVWQDLEDVGAQKLEQIRESLENSFEREISLEMLAAEVAEIFNVSSESAKIRIKQLGLDFAKSPVKQKTLFTIGYPSSVISL